MDASFLDKFKDPALASQLLETINRLAQSLEQQTRGQEIRLMEVCGTHTMAIAKAGLRQILPANINLISGPGCPVCVTANVDIDRVIALSYHPDVTITTFGDMMRVPGSSNSLQARKASGASVQVVYSPIDAIKLAQKNPQQHVTFVGVGFETTTPLIAATIERAASLGLDNFSVLAAHKAVPPALEALANDPHVSLDALILPGHVSTILGIGPYQFLADKYGIGGVVTGFEPVDILQGVAELLHQLQAGEPKIEIAYSRAVMPEGNPVARAAIERVFEICDAHWRGLGLIPDSGYQIRSEFSRFDANQRFEIIPEPTVEPKGCLCGDVLRGYIAPNQCKLFGTACTPANPIGPCMVSSEGSCAAYYRYQL
jgi:hydrogenase expression/formation protein HypD